MEESVEMAPDLQYKLLQVVQSKQLTRLGGEKPIEVDGRILAATSANVEQAVAGKKLREDLYYRLSLFTLHVPHFRQRKEEVPLLLHRFKHQLARHYIPPPHAFSTPSL